MFKPKVDSKSTEYIESSLTTMWKVDCTSQALPCLANTFLDSSSEASEKGFGGKIDTYLKTFLKEIEPTVEYKLEHCLVLRFHGSLLSPKKPEASKESGDNTTCSLVCPFKLE